MSIHALAAKARKHWEVWLPEQTRSLKASGTFSLETQKAAARAQKMITNLMRQGYQDHEAEEVALKEYILLDPEPGQDGLDEEMRAELEEKERDYQSWMKPLVTMPEE